MPHQQSHIPNMYLVSKGAENFLIRPLLHEVNPVSMKETPHRHTYQEILWVKEGEGQHTIDNELFSLRKNTFYLIYKGQIHYFIEGKKMQGFLIRFNNEFLDSTSPLDRTNIHSISNKRLNQLTLSAKEAKEFEALLKLLFKEFSETRHPSKDEILRNLLLAFLLKLEVKTHENQVQKLETANVNDETIYLKFLQLVELNYQKEKQIEFYTDKLIISSRKLSDITKRIGGKSAKQIIVDRLILAAKRILTFTNKSLKETAYQLGFEEIAYFCRLFKKYTGFTPTEYKAKAAKPVKTK